MKVAIHNVDSVHGGISILSQRQMLGERRISFVYIEDKPLSIRVCMYMGEIVVSQMRV